MAELEVAKHTKKIYKILNSKQPTVWHKVKELLIEIFIIVFAVSLSIWLHDKSEHNHQQKEAKEFLLGLREDLLADMKEMQDDRESYLKQQQAFKYVTSVTSKQALNADSLKRYKNWIFNTTRLQQNNGRFEGFKSAGKIGTIEDQVLQNNIMDLYQEDIPSLLASSDAYIRRKNQFIDYFIKNHKGVTDSSSNFSDILLQDEAQNLCATLANTSEIVHRYDVCINKMKAIVSDLETKYNIHGEEKAVDRE